MEKNILEGQDLAATIALLDEYRQQLLEAQQELTQKTFPASLPFSQAQVRDESDHSIGTGESTYAVSENSPAASESTYAVSENPPGASESTYAVSENACGITENFQNNLSLSHHQKDETHQ